MVFKRKMGPDGKRRRFSPLLWLSSLAAIILLLLGITGTLSQLQASITNDNNSVETGAPTFAFSESNNSPGNPTPAGTHCVTASAGENVTCSDINKYGDAGSVTSGVLPADDSRSTTVTLRNEANPTNGLAGDLHLVVDGCTQTPAVGALIPGTGTPAGNICTSGAAGLTVHLVCSTINTQTAVNVGPESLSTFENSQTPYLIVTGLTPQDQVECTFTVATASPLPANLQGVTASQDLVWVWTEVGNPVAP